ncbi:MAG: protein kinase domain-containing protein, partial [Acidimicrobiales bacterium]
AHGPMSPEMVDYLAGHLLGALAAAHRAGIVHRDIKPANVLFDEAGHAYLTDFGVATMRDATSGLTATELVIGTPEFMAPEQARGERATPASDVFSLGATLRYAATGTPPYGRGDARVILNRAAEGKIDRLPPELPKEVRDRIAPLLDKRPERRPTAAAAAQGGAGGTVALPRAARRTRPPGPRPGRGSRLWPTVAAVVVIALVGLAASAFALARSRSGQGSGAAATVTTESPSTTACVPLAYQACGAPAAPFTDGLRCTDDHADYDADAANGCEAAPDPVDGTKLTKALTANLVPADDIDRYPFHVTDSFQLFCDGSASVTLTAPEGVSMRLDVVDGDTPIGTTVSRDGTPATVDLPDPSCLGDDSTDLQARVSWVGDPRSATPYRLERSGSY